LTGSQALALFDAFYRSGALVFGGGHVVLPLLREAFVTPGSVSDDAFLAGYGAAQAVPGPLFTFAAYLGTVVGPAPHGIAGAVLGLIATFLPGMLILVGTLPFWDALRRRQAAQAAMRGVNAGTRRLAGRRALKSSLDRRGKDAPAEVAIALVGLALLAAWARAATPSCLRQRFWRRGAGIHKGVTWACVTATGSIRFPHINVAVLKGWCAKPLRRTAGMLSACRQQVQLRSGAAGERFSACQ
jgi:chromate transport protein ChrA